jgi:hypothetical protein
MLRSDSTQVKRKRLAGRACPLGHRHAASGIDSNRRATLVHHFFSPFPRRPIVLDIRVLRRFRSIWFAFSVLLLPAANHAAPFSGRPVRTKQGYRHAHDSVERRSSGPGQHHLIHQPRTRSRRPSP